MRHFGTVIATVLIAACGEPEQAQIDANKPQVQLEALPNNGAAALPDDRAPLEEPNGAIDPKGVEAAGQVVQSYGALIEQKRFAEADLLWGNAENARALSDELAHNKQNHMEIGKPGQTEGAAGSIYITVPVVHYGKSGDGAEFRRAGEVVLRRVNDVPGSTEAQRRWHIERVTFAG